MSEDKQYTMEEVSKHDKVDDLWMVINQKVYDVTSFVNDHPGGGDYLIQNAGKEATNEFLDVGHSQKAVDMLKDYYIGVCTDSKPLQNPLSSNPIPISTESPVIKSTESSSNNNNNEDKNKDVTTTIALVGGIVVAVASIAFFTFAKIKK
ncbi:cytochrome b5 B [Dictyostelium discoideum AX4]|uniref:Cytochrome b5 B n=1 Tax=Dictyostelium discoideum TaxID=44689 RepID=Q86L22_DICDI|nr:cytochrome b5 B [Dictyostelium discoideum AX4]EAL69041.1 cytochrome b5 B [Dictyostelium discoideum AX4]|eukprot:XP_642935.1 cytochrome b5 B [Dictyostelium discoideum AX4]